MFIQGNENNLNLSSFEWIEPSSQSSYSVQTWRQLIDNELMQDKHLIAYAKINDSTNLDDLKLKLNEFSQKSTLNECKRAWLVYVWIAEHIAYDYDAFMHSRFGDMSARGVCESGSSVCEGFSNLYVDLCQSLGLACEKVHGICKGFGSFNPSPLPSSSSSSSRLIERRHAWNLVRIEATWHLVDVTWGAGHLSSSYGFEKKFQPYYFMTPPQLMIYDHFPYETLHQLLNRSIGRNQFEQMLHLSISHHLLGLNCLSHSNYRAQHRLLDNAIENSSLKLHFVEFHLPSLAQLTANMYWTTTKMTTAKTSDIERFHRCNKQLLIQRDLKAERICFILFDLTASKEYVLAFYAHTINHSLSSRFNFTLSVERKSNEKNDEQLSLYSLPNDYTLDFVCMNKRITCVSHKSVLIRLEDKISHRLQMQFDTSHWLDAHLYLRIQVNETNSPYNENDDDDDPDDDDPDDNDETYSIKQAVLIQRNPQTNLVEVECLIVPPFASSSFYTLQFDVIDETNQHLRRNEFKFGIIAEAKAMSLLTNKVSCCKSTRLVKLNAIDKTSNIYLITPLVYELEMSMMHVFELQATNACQVWLDCACDGKYERTYFKMKENETGVWHACKAFTSNYNKSIDLNAMYKNKSGLGYIQSICSYFLID